VIVSIIIPVFNATAYINQAVKSALAQPETGEVILIEDGSSDNSLAVCRHLEKLYKKVILLRHAGGKNRGAGASRNLGIVNAKYDYIAFLDADDFYLPERFKAAASIFQRDDRVEGVYEATGIHFEDESARAVWQTNPLHKGRLLTTVDARLPPEKLFDTLVSGAGGSFTTNAIVVKRGLFDRAGLFDKNLPLHQDTLMWIKLSAVGRLVGGNLRTPVAKRRVHSHNRILNLPEGPNPHLKKMDQILRRWAQQNGLSRKQKNLLAFRKWCNILYDYNVWKRAEVESDTVDGLVQIRQRTAFLLGRLWSSPLLIFSPHLFRFLFGFLKRIRTRRLTSRLDEGPHIR